MVIIRGIEKGSHAQKADILPGEALISINGNDICDVLDYRFYEADSQVELLLEDTEGGQRSVVIRKGQYESIGLTFDTYLMDRQHSCRNRCIFCFIDQLPKGMRQSLYFKDDDSRLSFLFGNYVTLTNLSQHEADRIIKMRISPINVSVHTTNPALRCQMMGNRFAGESLCMLERFADAGIKINCQLVLCPGINDGEELERSLRELGELAPQVQSIAAVPVGITAHRDGLYPLEPYGSDCAAEVLDITHKWGERFLERHGARIVFAADEFYLCAGRPIPPAEFYEEFPQIENGVGLMASLSQEFLMALEQLAPIKAPRRVTVATGAAAATFIRSLLDQACGKCNYLTVEVIPVINNFFGDTITVAGLLTGGDLIGQLRGRELGDALLIPAVALRREGDVFLDGVSLEAMEKELRIRVIPVKNDGYELLDAVTGE